MRLIVRVDRAGNRQNSIIRISCINVHRMGATGGRPDNGRVIGPGICPIYFCVEIFKLEIVPVFSFDPDTGPVRTYKQIGPHRLKVADRITEAPRSYFAQIQECNYVFGECDRLCQIVIVKSALGNIPARPGILDKDLHIRRGRFRKSRYIVRLVGSQRPC